MIKVDATLTYLGATTTLIRLGGFTLLTDPVFGPRPGWPPWRRTPEAVHQPRDLPALDAVLLSRPGRDRFDAVARHGLDPEGPVVTTPAVAERLRGWGFTEAVGLTPWSTMDFKRSGQRLAVTAVPAARSLWPPGRPVLATILELDSPSPLRLYVAPGPPDAATRREVAGRIGPVDVLVAYVGFGRRRVDALARHLRPRLVVPVPATPRRPAGVGWPTPGVPIPLLP